MSEQWKQAVFGAFLFVGVMATLQVAIFFFWALTGCTKYESLAEAEQRILFVNYFNLAVIVLTGVLIVGFFCIYRISPNERYVRGLGCCFVLWAILTTIRDLWETSDCGSVYNEKYWNRFEWIGPYLSIPIMLLKIALILGVAYCILCTRFRTNRTEN